jgi:hypothetical protein
MKANSRKPQPKFKIRSGVAIIGESEYWIVARRKFKHGSWFYSFRKEVEPCHREDELEFVPLSTRLRHESK